MYKKMLTYYLPILIWFLLPFVNYKTIDLLNVTLDISAIPKENMWGLLGAGSIVLCIYVLFQEAQNLKTEFLRRKHEDAPLRKFINQSLQEITGNLRHTFVPNKILGVINFKIDTGRWLPHHMNENVIIAIPRLIVFKAISRASVGILFQNFLIFFLPISLGIFVTISSINQSGVLNGW